ncbi:hypothetical protein [Halorubrum salinum]|uniref:hypothetical protein n=1 Tax=Halorubrum salinum TaxID=767517 RepID=UPI0021128740|nr:hypothetical protein [Halorubrum salinum]
MSSSGLPSGDNPSPNAVLGGTIEYLSNGGSLGTLLQGAIFGTIVSFATGGVNLIQSAFGLVVAPLDALRASVSQFVDSAILAPLGIIETTAEASASATASEFGPFAIIVGVGLVLASFWMITQYLEEPETGDTLAIPGLGDAPDIPGLPLGVTEENEDED